METLAAPRSSFVRHPLLEGIATLPPDSSDYTRIRSSIAAEGIREPLKCLSESDRLLVLDGLHRLRIAGELGIEHLPYQLVESEPISFVCASVVRAGWSKSALAYRMWPFFSAVACQHGGRRKKMPTGNDFPMITAAEIALKIGVSEKLVDQARSAHEYFEREPQKRRDLEPLILTSLLPLHRIRALHEGKAPPEEISVRQLQSTLKRLPKAFRDWEKIAPPKRYHLGNAAAEAIRKLPKEMQIAILETLEIAWRD